MLNWFKFKRKTAEEVYSKYKEEINLPFSQAYRLDITKEYFLYIECENKIQEIQSTVPIHLLDYVAFIVIADDFYEAHKPLVIYEDSHLFITKKYFENYSKFCTREH